MDQRGAKPKPRRDLRLADVAGSILFIRCGGSALRADRQAPGRFRTHEARRSCRRSRPAPEVSSGIIGSLLARLRQPHPLCRPRKPAPHMRIIARCKRVPAPYCWGVLDAGCCGRRLLPWQRGQNRPPNGGIVVKTKLPQACCFYFVEPVRDHGGDLFVFLSSITWELPWMPLSANWMAVGFTPACCRYFTVQWSYGEW